MPRRLSAAAPACLAAALLALFAGRAAEPAGSGAGRTVTLRGEGIPLDRALADLARQTGIPVRDRRGAAAQPKLKLDLKRATFWQAVDAIARQAGAGVSLYQPDGSPALVDPPAGRLPVSHDGIFRSAVKRLTLLHDLETGAHSGTVQLEVAWEPGFRPLLLDVKSYEATFAPDAKGRSLRASRQGSGPTDVHGRPAGEIELALPAPDRSAPALAGLKGKLLLVGSAKMLTVRFGRLGQASKPQAQTPEKGVRVTLRRLTVVDTDRWEAEMEVSYPAGGPAFESFFDWLVYNKVYLEKGTGARRVRFVPGPADQQGVSRTANRAVVVYQFVEGKGRPRLGRPRDWALVYETPGRFVEVPGSFTFKNLPLP
jgi:hypothetical protein